MVRPYTGKEAEEHEDCYEMLSCVKLLLRFVVGGVPSEDPPLCIVWALLRNSRTLFGCASQVGQKGAQRPGVGNEDVPSHAAERDIEHTSNLAVSASEVPLLAVEQLLA